jgi:ABC-type glutathione transport system ATPase component
LADEPTSALDEDAREAFLKILIFECRAAGAGLIFASHDRRLSSEFGKEARLVKRGERVLLEEAGAEKLTAPIPEQEARHEEAPQKEAPQQKMPQQEAKEEAPK